MKPQLIFLFLILSGFFAFAQQDKKTATATRFTNVPEIDGWISDSCWKECESIIGFTQYVPVYGAEPSQRTIVYIGYDDEAVYVAAMMFDTAPDSILRELGNRDDGDLNADKFGIQFDTYNMQTDSYTFMVWASGVQYDSRYYDPTYSGVWKSAVKILDNGWSCEMKISYSAIRFPAITEQNWGVQIYRGIRRKRETDQWALEVKGSDNEMIYWGKLVNIQGIKAPLRLSLTPFISGSVEHYPYYVKGKSNFSYAFSGGLDLKYGINESFTLDVTLLPDFSQVQSDYQVKNISAFETVYEEYRPFFTEATDLFMLGDLFYSRRIGRRPAGYYSLNDSLGASEFIKKNPERAKLINAVKLSGRNKNGTALGFFNALTNNMYAEISDSSGNKRKILTEPLTNYNIIVIDQILKNNSEVYFVNTNVIRTKGYDDANVSLLGFKLNNKTNRWQISGSGGLSQQFSRNDSVKNFFSDRMGYTYRLAFGKVSGKFQFSVSRNVFSDQWNANDLGLVLQNNYSTNILTFKYNIYEPFWKFRNMNNNFSIIYNQNFLTGRTEEFKIELSNNFTTSRYLTVWEGLTLSPLHVSNYYETRVPGRYFIIDRWFSLYGGFSSDYRRRFALDGSVDYWQDIAGDGHYISVRLSPIFRISNHFSFNLSSQYESNINDVGFADMDQSGNIIFGKRDINTLVNQAEARYIFKNNLSLSLMARHYWAGGFYSDYYKLALDGSLISDPALVPQGDHDFNFNAFNIDLIFFWEFAPGSSLNIVYKNIIADEDNVLIHNYFENLKRTFSSDQLNTVTVKVLYYLDYQYIARGITKKKKIHDQH